MAKKILLFIYSTFLLNYQIQADHPNGGNIGVIKEFAHDLEKTSKKLHEYTEDIFKNPNSIERELIEFFHKFEKETKRFHQLVESNINTPKKTERGFYDLIFFFNKMAFFVDENLIPKLVESLYLKATHYVEEINEYYSFWNYLKVKEIAHDIDRVSNKLYKTVYSIVGKGSNSHERQAVKALLDFATASHEYHERVEESYANPENTRLLMRDLLDTHFDADFEIDYIKVDPFILKQFFDLKPLIERLKVIYRWNWYPKN